MNQIPTIQIYPPQPTIPPPLPISMTVPLSYDFQVAEHLDDNDKVIRVALQVKVNFHDQYGNITTHGTWVDVPRVQLKF